MGGAANYTGGIVYFDTFNTLLRNNVLIEFTKVVQQIDNLYHHNGKEDNNNNNNERYIYPTKKQLPYSVQSNY